MLENMHYVCAGWSKCIFFANSCKIVEIPHFKTLPRLIKLNLFIYIFVVLGVGSKASLALGKCVTTEVHLPLASPKLILDSFPFVLLGVEPGTVLVLLVGFWLYCREGWF